jgi:mRNA-degrading endonuclease RelE of RelBE toxin-antitoxin system
MTTEIVIKQMPAFKKVYKKLHANYKSKVNDAIKLIVKDPTIGEEKKGDLTGVYVYKFKIHHQEILLAYEWHPKERLLLALGVHENFYRDLNKSPLHPPFSKGENST